MENDIRQLKKRFEELYDRAETRGYAVYSDFLTLAEQDVLLSTVTSVELIGGYTAAERKIACFGESYGAEPPCVWLKIEPRQQKFADKLTHRDFLGSLLGLGIKRELLGDIIIYENCGYLYCLESISGFIAYNLTSVKRTSVECKAVDAPPETSTGLPDESVMTVASARLDALVAEVFNLSRSQSAELFAAELVFVNARVARKPAAEPNEGDIISVRGKGRFIYGGALGETKKGRLRVSVRVYK